MQWGAYSSAATSFGRGSHAHNGLLWNRIVLTNGKVSQHHIALTSTIGELNYSSSSSHCTLFRGLTKGIVHGLA